MKYIDLVSFFWKWQKLRTKNRKFSKINMRIRKYFISFSIILKLITQILYIIITYYYYCNTHFCNLFLYNFVLCSFLYTVCWQVVKMKIQKDVRCFKCNFSFLLMRLFPTKWHYTHVVAGKQSSFRISSVFESDINI